MSELVMGYQTRPKTNIRCDKCHKMIGKDAAQKIAYTIKNGIGQGTFCSGTCVNAARNEMEESFDQEINDIINFGEE